jgi:hypothetical protein
MKIALFTLLALSDQDDAFVQLAEKRVERFQKTLERSPEDQEACEAVGRFLCFVKGSWDQGLPLLAKGKDVRLKELADTDLGTVELSREKGSLLTGATFDFGEEVAVEVVKGDLWWTEAKNHPTNVEKLNAYGRAAHWYRLATRKVSAAHRKRLYSRVDAHAKILGAVQVRVQASVPWTDTGVEVIEGQKIKLTVKGKWVVDKARPQGDWNDWTGAKGIVRGTPVADGNIMCLIGKIGPDGRPYACYKSNPKTADADGRIFLGPNDWDDSDNAGELTVMIELSLLEDGK